MMRTIHRWISTIGMVTLFYLVVTGTVLAIDEFIQPATFAEPVTAAGPGPGMRAPAPLAIDQVEAMTQTVLKAALAASPEAPVNAVRVRLQMQGDQPQGVVTLAGTTTRTLTFNALTGEPLTVANQPNPGGGGTGREPSLNGLLQAIHSGAIVGRGGQWVIILTGLGFVVLSFTGIWMYFQLRGARVKRGRQEWFWSR